MQKHIINIALLLFSFVAVATASGKTCETLLLDEMKTLLHKQGIDVALGTDCFYSGHKIIVEVNDSVITDIRFQLFSDDTRQCLLPEISKFVERYLLYLSLLPATDRNQLLADDHVEFKIATLQYINDALDLSLQFNNNRYKMEWKKGGRVVSSISFPNQYELISGRNKIESGKAFQHRLECASSEPSPNREIPQIDGLETNTDSTLFIQRGACYMISDINSDKYFVKVSNDSIVPIHSTIYPVESIYNLFGSLIDGNYTLHVTQHLYGGGVKIFDVPLRNFINASSTDGNNIYVGVENIDGSQVKATIIAENYQLGYNHLMSITVDRSILARKQGTIDTEVYAYIPTHNLKSLFADKKNL